MKKVKIDYMMGGAMMHEEHEAPRISCNLHPSGRATVRLTEMDGTKIKSLTFRRAHRIETIH